MQYQGSLSRWRKSRVGTFQGAPSSPGIFNFFVSDWEPEPQESEVDESFADDIHAASSDPDTEVVSESLGRKAEALSDWADGNGMTVSAQKSSVTLFTPWTKQVNKDLRISIKGTPVPMEKFPKLLGVKFDPLFTFSHHAAMVASRASSDSNSFVHCRTRNSGRTRSASLALLRPLSDPCSITQPL